MATTLNPYLSFRDEARSAMDLYQSVFGGEVTRSTFGELNMSEDPAEAEKIMHSQLVTPGGMVLMAADTPNSMEYTSGGPISGSLSGSDEAELSGYFERLSADGGTVVLPLEKAPWGDSFGMCRDRFGISWMVNIGGSPT
jgi:PhnB protein